MNHSDHPTEESLYQQAMELASPAEREAFLIEACGEDAALLAKVRELLACDAEAADQQFLPTVISDGGRHVASPQSEQPGATVGPYKLREQIGEGGFGTVWVADQEQPVRRRVALKIIKLGMGTKEVIARFEQERQALALMDHPNIAKVLDAGTTESGRPYFVMELVRGVKITEFCDEQRLPMVERINLFITVCQAVQHAHQKGIIHRDLKPSNILVSLNDGKAVPKVIDFGIAKATQGRLTDGTIYTQFEQMIGTPLYMSPEQAQMTSLDIDTRSDIYALGVLLYELLTGRTPIDTATMAKAGMDEIRRLIREVDPPRPSARVKTLGGEELTTMAKRRKAEPAKLTGILSGDIDWIVMKCLEKDRARRYDTANGLALDLQRHLANEVVTARPPTAAYLLGKLIRRHRVAFAAGTAIAASLVLGIAAATWMYFRERDAREQTAAERDAKEQARKEAEDISKFLGEVFQSPDPARDGREIKVVELLDNAAKKLETNLASQPGQRASMQFTLGRTYLGLGLPRQAIPLLEKVRDYCLATEHPMLASTIHSLASSYYGTGRRDEALKMQEEVLALILKVNGPDHIDTLRATHNLAAYYHAAGRPDEALKIREEVLRLRRKALGPEHPDTLWAMASLAESCADAGRRDEALKMQEEVLALSRKVLDPEHPDTLDAMGNLASYFFNAGRKDEALKLIEEVLALSRKVNGPEHPDTLYMMKSLAVSYFDAGRKDEALKLREEELPLRRKVNGPEHPDTLKAISNLAESCADAGRLEEAIKLQEEALALSRKVNGPEHRDTLTEMRILAKYCGKAGRHAEEFQLEEQLLPLQQKVLGPEHLETLGTMTNLAISFASAGRLPEAVTLQEQALALKRRVLPPDHSFVANALGNLAALYEKTGRKDEAAALRKERSGLNPQAREKASPPVVATLIPPDSDWKWLHPTDGVDPAEKDADFHSTFYAANYDDSGWKTGKDNADPNGGFGYGRDFTGVDIGTPEDETHRHSAYFRHRFTTDKPYTSLELRCQRDDALIVYLDGREVLRDNLPPGPDAYLLSATIPQGPSNDGVFRRYPLPGTLEPGEHILAVSVHNTELPSSDLRLGGVTLVEVEKPSGE